MQQVIQAIQVIQDTQATRGILAIPGTQAVDHWEITPGGHPVP